MQDPGKGGAPNRRVERVLKRVPVVRRCTVGLGRSPPGGGGGTRFPEKGGSVCLEAGRRGDAHTHGDSRRTEGGRSILTADRRTKGSRKQRVHARSMQIEWKVTGGWTSERAARGACKRMCCTSMPGADWLRSQRSPGAGDSFRDGSAQRTQTAGGSVGRSVDRWWREVEGTDGAHSTSSKKKRKENFENFARAEDAEVRMGRESGGCRW